MKKPIQIEWDTMFACLESYLEYLRENEPYATNTIRLLEEVEMELSPDVDETFSS